MPMRMGDALPKFDGATEWLNELQETADDYVSGSPASISTILVPPANLLR